MKRYVERRVGLAHRIQHKVSCTVHAGKINAKMRKIAVEPDGKHPVCPLAHRLGTQKRKRGCGFRIHVKGTGAGLSIPRAGARPN